MVAEVPEICRARLKALDGAVIQVACDPDRMLHDASVYVVVGIDVDAAHGLNELACLCEVLAAGSIQSFANKMKRHSNLLVLQVRLSSDLLT
jgi:hypothetical protein